MAFDENGPAPLDSGLFGTDASLTAARVVVIPVPFEATVSYRPGTAQGPAAILAASRQVDLLDADVGRPFEEGIALDPPALFPALNDLAREAAVRVIDALVAGADANPADIALVDDAGAQVNRVVRERTSEVLRDGCIPAVVGGDHSVPYGAIAAAASFLGDKPLGILHFDAHADLRDAYEGFQWSHASIMRNVVDRIPTARLVQVGIRDFCDEELECIKSQPGRITTYFDAQLRKARLSGQFADLAHVIVSNLPENVWISFDIDGLDPALCPSTGTPVPGGLSFDEAVYVLEALVKANRRVIGVDLVEVAPTVGVADLGAGWDQNVGARLLYKLIGTALLSRGLHKVDLPKPPGIV